MNNDFNRPRRVKRGIPQLSSVARAQGNTLLFIIFREKLVIESVCLEIWIEDIAEHRTVIRCHRRWVQKDFQEALLGMEVLKVYVVYRQSSARRISLIKRHIWKYKEIKTKQYILIRICNYESFHLLRYAISKMLKKDIT